MQLPNPQPDPTWSALLPVKSLAFPTNNTPSAGLLSPLIVASRQTVAGLVTLPNPQTKVS